MKSTALSLSIGLAFGNAEFLENHSVLSDKLFNWIADEDAFAEWMAAGADESFTGRESPFLFATRLLTRIQTWANDVIVGDLLPTVVSEYPYWNIMPSFIGSVLPNGDLARFSGKCFDFSATAHYTTSGEVSVKLLATKTDLAPCSDIVVLKTVTGMLYQEIDAVGAYDFQWTMPSDARDAETWDLETKGIRFHVMPFNKPTLLRNLMETLKLFVPVYTLHVPDQFMELNREFLESYTDYRFPDRTTSDDDFDVSQVQSGDLFSVSRFDGMAPAMMFGMGSKSGHTTMALEIDGEMMIVQSTDASAYWPSANIQRCPIQEWVDAVREADYLGVHVPLSEESRQLFNATAAVEFFESVEGFEYGYYNFIFGWIDLLKDNFPCMPPDYSSVCMQWEFLETMMAIGDRISPSIADKMWNQAFNHRLGTSGLRTAELYQEAFNQGMTSNDIITIVEQDDWVYDTTRNGQPAVGPSYVCDVFACSTLKAAGVFGEVGQEFNCVEFSDFDVFALNVFDGEMTQFTGLYEFQLNGLNSKELFAHEGETCPTIPPSYLGRDTC